MWAFHSYADPSFGTSGAFPFGRSTIRALGICLLALDLSSKEQTTFTRPFTLSGRLHRGFVNRSDNGDVEPCSNPKKNWIPFRFFLDGYTFVSGSYWWTKVILPIQVCQRMLELEVSFDFCQIHPCILYLLVWLACWLCFDTRTSLHPGKNCLSDGAFDQALGSVLHPTGMRCFRPSIVSRRTFLASCAGTAPFIDRLW